MGLTDINNAMITSPIPLTKHLFLLPVNFLNNPILASLPFRQGRAFVSHQIKKVFNVAKVAFQELQLLPYAFAYLFLLRFLLLCQCEISFSGITALGSGFLFQSAERV